MSGLLSELKRRNVIRMAGLYLVGAWLLTQVSATVLPLFNAPLWMPRGVVIALIIGFIPAMIFAWVFELTPDGLKRDEDVSPQESIAPHTAQKMNRLIVALLVLAVVYFGFDKFVLAPKREAALVSVATQAITEKVALQQKSENEKSIAVLAFSDLSPSKDQEYFSDGMAEEILNSLAKINDLKVAGRTSSFFFKGKNEDIRLIGKALGVANVLEGSVRKQGDKVRITAQLIRANDGFHLWSETYDGDLKDVFALQEKIAQAIAGELQIILQGEQKTQLVSVGTNNTEAYQFYLQGRYHWNKRTSEEFEKAVVFFKQAIEKDPDYALAYSGLADTYSLFPNYGDYRRKDYMPQAKAAALKALELNPNLAEAHASLGEAIYYYEYDWTGAEKAFKRAIELNPKYATAHQWYAELLANSGKHDEANKHVTTALELDPFSMVINRDMIFWYLNAKRYDEALLQNKKLNELFPDELIFHTQNGIIYEAQGKYSQAFNENIRAFKSNKFVKPEQVQMVKAAYEKDGWAGYGKAYQTGYVAFLDAKQENDKHSYVRAMDYAYAYANTKDKDKAMYYLNKAYDERSHQILQLNVDFTWDFLRDDPRFKALVKKVGIPE
jgi:adenylate cyclase